MIQEDGALQVFADKNPNMTLFVRGEIGARVLLAVAPRRLSVCMEGDASCADLLAVLRDARAAGHFESDDFSALVDMTGFTGTLDWQLIPKISEVMPKGDSETNKNAYVVRDALLSTLIKVSAMLFPKTKHASFVSEAKAREWLGWDR